MPFTMKIQPIDSDVGAEGTKPELLKPVARSRLKRLLERQFPGVLRIPAAEKVAAGEDAHSGNAWADLEPSSVCLAKMVQNFMEENHEKSVRCSRNRCNCDDGSDADSDSLGETTYPSSAEALKGLVAGGSAWERNLLAETARIVEKNKMVCKRKDGACRKVVSEGLLALGYDASICKSRWEKSPFYPAGEYEYIDVIIGKERVIVDVDFRSEFEIARPTKGYKTILQTLPYIFVGKCDRLQSMVGIASEAAKQSLKKKGMHLPPWRKVEYVKAKWLSPHTREGIKEDGAEKKQLLNGEELDESSKGMGMRMMMLPLKPPEPKPRSSLSALAAVLSETP